MSEELAHSSYTPYTVLNRLGERSSNPRAPHQQPSTVSYKLDTVPQTNSLPIPRLARLLAAIQMAANQFLTTRSQKLSSTNGTTTNEIQHPL